MASYHLKPLFRLLSIGNDSLLGGERPSKLTFCYITEGRKKKQLFHLFNAWQALVERLLEAYNVRSTTFLPTMAKPQVWLQYWHLECDIDILLPNVKRATPRNCFILDVWRFFWFKCRQIIIISFIWKTVYSFYVQLYGSLSLCVCARACR